MHNISVTLETLPDPPKLESIWRSLATRSDHSIFQSWPWVRCWLDMPDVEPSLLIARDGDTVVGLALIQDSIQHRRFMRIPTLYLQETGDPDIDSLFIEYNGFLTDRACSNAVVAACLNFLITQPDGWRELQLSGVSDTLKTCAEQADAHCEIRSDRTSYFVDLDTLRAQDQPYLDALSRNTRQHHNRSRRHLEKIGPLQLHRARDVSEALIFLEELKRLHQQTWQLRGKTGAFGNLAFELFHQRLIETAFSEGLIDVLKFQVGDTPFGYLLNFVHEGIVYQYQSGIDSAHDQHRPGYIAHAAAIEYYLDAGKSEYNFMVGDNQQKLSLSTNTEQLFWLTLQRPSLGMRLENFLRSLHAGLGRS